MIKQTILTSLACLGMALSLEAQRVSSPIGHRTPVRVATHGCDSGGSYQWIDQRVWVPGHYDEITIPAQYGWRFDSCGRRYWALIHPARCERVWHPGSYEVQKQRIWVPHQRHSRGVVIRSPHVRSGPRGRPAPRVVQRGRTVGRRR